jgi:hypothetical protein
LRRSVEVGPPENYACTSSNVISLGKKGAICLNKKVVVKSAVVQLSAD